GLDKFAVVEALERVVARQHRFLLRRAEVGEHEPVALLERIPRLAHADPSPRTAIRLARLLEAVALHVEQPAVVAAADAAFLDAAVVERGAAMRTVRLD